MARIFLWGVGGVGHGLLAKVRDVTFHNLSGWCSWIW